MIEVTDEMRKAVLQWDSAADGCETTDWLIKRIIELHEANKPKPEPVAYRWWNQGCNCDECDQYFYSEDPDFISKNREPLYTTPPTREPLSDDDIWRIYDEGDNVSSSLEFARSIEQAHGIGAIND